MIKLQFKLPQALISRGFTRRTVFHAPAFQQKGIKPLMDIYHNKIVFYFIPCIYKQVSMLKIDSCSLDVQLILLIVSC